MITLGAVINFGLPLVTLSEPSAVSMSQAWFFSPQDGCSGYTSFPKEMMEGTTPKEFPGTSEPLYEPKGAPWLLFNDSPSSWLLVSLAVKCPSHRMTHELHKDRIWISLFDQVPLESYTRSHHDRHSLMSNDYLLDRNVCSSLSGWGRLTPLHPTLLIFKLKDWARWPPEFSFLLSTFWVSTSPAPRLCLPTRNSKVWRLPECGQGLATHTSLTIGKGGAKRDLGFPTGHRIPSDFKVADYCQMTVQEFQYCVFPFFKKEKLTEL